MWTTGAFVTHSIKTANNFSSDNWAGRSKDLLPSVLGIKDESWALIYDHALCSFKTTTTPNVLQEDSDDADADLERRFQLLRSDPDFEFEHLPYAKTDLEEDEDVDDGDKDQQEYDF
jgi:hypothetical protein